MNWILQYLKLKDIKKKSILELKLETSVKVFMCFPRYAQAFSEAPLEMQSVL